MPPEDAGGCPSVRLVIGLGLGLGQGQLILYLM